MDAPTTLIISIVAMLIATWLTRFIDWVVKIMHKETDPHAHIGGFRNRATALLAISIDLVVMSFIIRSISLVGWYSPLTLISAALLAVLCWGVRIIIKDISYFFK